MIYLVEILYLTNPNGTLRKTMLHLNIGNDTICYRTHLVTLIAILMLAGIVSANPSFSPDEGKMPLTVQFTLPGGDLCDKIEWNFGDDTSSSEKDPSHTYKKMSFFYPTCVCTLPGATITYSFDKIVSSNANSADSTSADQHYPIETVVDVKSDKLALTDQIKQGKGLYSLGLYDYAAKSYKKAMKLSKSDPDILSTYGSILSGLSRWNEAASVYKQSLAIRKDPSVLNAYGGVMIQMNKFEPALEVYNQTLEIDSGNPQAYAGRGKAYELLKMNDEACAAYKKSLSLDENQPTVWVGYGNVLNMLKKYPESVKAYEKAISLGVSGADIYNKYGGVLRKVGRDGDAQRAMNKARSFQGQLSSSSNDYVPSCSAGGVM